MNNAYATQIAEYLLTQKANQYKGINAKDITEALDLPTNTAYRVLRSTGFYISKTPKWPRAYYYDSDKAMLHLVQEVSAVQTAEALTIKAKDVMSQANHIMNSMTPLGKILSQTESAIEPKLLENIGSLPKSLTLQEVKDNINQCDTPERIKAYLILFLVAANRNLIVEDIKVEN